MSKIKKAGIILLLIVVTVCVIFLPRYMSRQNEEKLLQKKVYRNCDVRGSKKITSKQIAELYCNNGFTIGGNFASSFNSMDDKKATGDLDELVNTVFESNELVKEGMKSIINKGELHFERSNILTMIDNQPIALSFVSSIVICDNDTLEFMYEEKTKTLIYMYYNYQGAHELGESVSSFEESFPAAVSNYCEKQLGLKSDSYYCEFNYLGDYENEVGDVFMRYSINFGLIQTEPAYDKSGDMID